MTIETAGLFYINTPLPAWARFTGGSGFDDRVNGFNDTESENFHMERGDLVYITGIEHVDGVDKGRGMMNVTFLSSEGKLRRVRWWAQNQNALGCVEKVVLRDE